MKQLKFFSQTVFITLLCVLIYYFFKTKNIEKPGKLDGILSLVNEKYVDPVDVHELQKVALNAIFDHLDPHSAYLEKEDIESRNEDLQGTFYGIGVRYSIIRDSLVVTGIVEDGPASKSNLKIGDRLLKVDGTAVEGKWLKGDSIKQLLKGFENSIVELTVHRKIGNQILTIPITRGIVIVPTVDAYYFVRPDIGYLRLNTFGENTPQEVLNTIQFLIQKGANKLIFDLRDNGGGYLKSVLHILEELLPANHLVLFTQGKSSPREDFYTIREGALEDLPLAVLINQNSASASEIMAGTLQDYDRAVLVGRRSFGKGLVQEPFTRQDSSEVLLTIAKYYTPSGRCLQKPYKKAKEKYYKDDVTERIKSGELLDKHKIPYDHHQVYFTTNGRKVYGGGGVIPDLFVPISNTAPEDRFIDSLLSKRILLDFSFLQAEHVQFKLPYQNFEQIRHEMNTSDEALHEFLAYAHQQKFDMPELSEAQAEKIKYWIKAYTLFHIFQNDEFYFEQFVSLDDEIMKTAIASFDNYENILKYQL